jgi:hypothetical protein
MVGARTDNARPPDGQFKTLCDDVLSPPGALAFCLS